MSRILKRTAETDRLIDVEARRRAEKLPPSERLSNKQIAKLTGLSQLYVAQLIAARRREISTAIDVSRETSTAVESTHSTANL